MSTKNKTEKTFSLKRFDYNFMTYSRVWNKHSPTLINFLTFFPGATALFQTP